MSETVTQPAEVTTDAPKKAEMGGGAIVILSGGQDSTTALFWAKARYGKVKAITINYGQRHTVEIDAAKKVAELAQVPHEIIDVPGLLLGDSPLVNPEVEVAHYPNVDALPGGLEATFVPARNPFFIVLAANRAAVEKVDTLVLGLCMEDFGGYHDCRQQFVDAMAMAMSEALTGRPNRFHIETPLMFLTKAEIVNKAQELGPECWEALGVSHTCYDGQYPPNPFNHASLLRAKGFAGAGLPDPLIQRAIREGLLPVDYPTSGLVEGTKYADGKAADTTKEAPTRKTRVKKE